MKNDLGDGPIQKEYEAMMIDVAHTLNNFFNGSGPKKTGFVLLVFPYGEAEGCCNYISNGAHREDIITLLEEQVMRFKEQRPKPKTN